MNDPYVDPRTGVLRNKLGITDESELAAAEADVTAAALFALEMSPFLGEGHFDFAHLRALHVQIFGEIYRWAGKPRTVNIARSALFCPVQNIEPFASSVFTELRDENYLVGLDRSDLVKRVAALYGQLNALHPFREGNGRTQRAFITQLGRLGGWRVAWAGLDRAVNDEASRRSLERGDDDGLTEMIDELLTHEPEPAVPTGVPRRVVLVIPDVASALPGGVEELRRGPYPAEVVCSQCHEEFALRDEPCTVLRKPVPPPLPGWFAFAHARCSRSRVLPAPSARELREWQAERLDGGDDATGVAIVLATNPRRAAFAWRPEAPLLASAGADVLDLFLNIATSLGLRSSASLAVPTERVPGWAVAVRPEIGEVVVVDPEGVRQFAGTGLDLPREWVDAIGASGECALFAVSRGELTPNGMKVAAQQGRVVSGLAAASLVE